MSVPNLAALRQYRSSGVTSQISDASPHRLIAMLYDGALERLALAASGITWNNLDAKLRGIDSTMAIIEHLLCVLDYKAGGDIASRLAALYDYMMRRLLQAKLNNDLGAVNEVTKLMRTLQSGWDAIAPKVG